MSRLPITSPASSHGASPHLLVAALAGLLCMTGCIKEDAQPTPSTQGHGGEPNESGVGGAAASGAVAGNAAGMAAAGRPAAVGGMGGGGAGGTADGAGAPALGGGGAGETPAAGASSMAGSGGAAPEPPHITSDQNVGVMTVEQFTALCDERVGTVEVMPHCGGFATAKGFSYDSSTELLSEHTCQGANTCGGWNCVIPD